MTARLGRRLWRGVQEPRLRTVLYWLSYLVLLGIGLHDLLVPSSFIQHELPVPGLVVGWDVILIAAGLSGAVAALPGWWWLERIAITLTVTGLTIYLTTLIDAWLRLHRADTLTEAGLVVFAILSVLARFTVIRKLSYGPRVVPRRGQR
jgi:hypothetical protein